MNRKGELKPAAAARPHLSPQQSLELKMLAKGARTAQIADQLCIEQDTVRKYFRRILERLEIEPEANEDVRLVLMRWAVEHRGQWNVVDGRQRRKRRGRR